MRYLACFLLALGIPGALAGASAPAVILDVWPGPPPGEENFRPPGPNSKARPPKDDGTLRVPLVTQPRLMIFRPPPERANGTAIVVCPGGGYNILAWNLEGTEIAEWLNSIGVTAAVLEYRVPRRDPKQPYVAPLQDAQRALRHVREKAGNWHVDPKRVGILGFSAGGHLAVMAALHSQESGYSRIDAIDDLSARPDFVVPVYPAYLGNEDTPGPLDPLVRVTGATPPMFIVVTHDDRLRGMNAALLYAELKRAGVPAELHVFAQGGHGYGMRPSANPVSHWPKLCEDWLRTMGLLTKKT